jgi:CDP-diacylglycerol--serine O-phosphatidyltransferase
VTEYGATEQTTPKKAPRRAVFLVPAALTIGNIFLGFFGVIQALQGRFDVACICVVGAAVLDKFDGLVARKTGTESDFGRELDSLADVVSFGMAPAFIAYTWGLHLLPKVGWIVAFLYLMCGALRLARFNVQSASTDRSWFVGLPTPVAASIPVTLILAYAQWSPDAQAPTEPGSPLAWLLLGAMATAAFLMVSTVRYFAFKDLRVERSQRLLALLSLVLLVAALGAWPSQTFLALCLAYVLHGPIARFLPGRRRAAPAEVPVSTGPDAPATPTEGGSE